MKSLTKLFLILVMISLVGFTIVETQDENKQETITVLTSEQNPTIAEDADVNASIVNYIDKGVMTASWYGTKFHGKKTANGEVYNQTAFTAAHKVFRFGTLLKITNPRNNKSVIVRINDRGPYIRGRELDLSKASAKALGMSDKGIAKLQVEQISLKGVNFPVITLN